MQQSKPLERCEDALELRAPQLLGQCGARTLQISSRSVREGRVRVSCPTRISQRALTRFIEENLEKSLLDVHAKAQLESRRNANPLSALLCDGGRVAYEGKFLGYAVTRTLLIRNNPLTPMSCLSVLRLQLLSRKLQPLCRSGSKNVLRNACPSASPFGRTKQVCIRRTSVSAMPKAVGQLHATRCGTAFLAFDLFTCVGVGLCHRARACPPAAFRSFFRLLE